MKNEIKIGNCVICEKYGCGTVMCIVKETDHTTMKTANVYIVQSYCDGFFNWWGSRENQISLM